MRLWHKDLIHVLPKQQLIGQWRECCLIAKEIKEKGTPNHILVNPIMQYPEDEFSVYSYNVYREMCKRGYKTDWYKFAQYREFPSFNDSFFNDQIFKGWHNDRYLFQCYSNLQEKYDRGGISQVEWNRIEVFMLNRQIRLLREKEALHEEAKTTMG